jgi:Na+-driven multidrug efflux pump
MTATVFRLCGIALAVKFMVGAFYGAQDLDHIILAVGFAAWADILDRKDKP